ncbi:MAG: anti-sigma-factor antagonist [Puniceicoccaceae bacterium 5H]|nr:MAG: anti-sigma-factor antagonist [Puniceicoccaceae bacterium 5H]
MYRIPILRVEEFLLVSIQTDLDDALAVKLQDDLTTAIATHHARGVIIDISGLEIVDSFIGRMLADISTMARIQDCHAIVVGMQPAVAITLVELGLSLSGVQTALHIDQGMRFLRRFLAGRDEEASDERE